MKTRTGLLAVATLLSLATVAFAQQPAPEGAIIMRHRMFQGPEGAPPPPPDGNFVFIASESFGGKVVKGAPYSAEAITESIQTLSDGNRIINKFSSSVYRDSEGRTRREQSFKGLGVIGGGEEPLKTIFIHDPVAGVTFSLDSRTHIAHKSAPFTFEFRKKIGDPTTAHGQRFEFKVERGTATGGNVIMTAPPLGVGAEATRVPHSVVEDGARPLTFSEPARAPTPTRRRKNSGNRSSKVLKPPAHAQRSRFRRATSAMNGRSRLSVNAGIHLNCS